jgi:hypothetical protein
MRFLSFSNKKKNSAKKIRTRSVERSVWPTDARNASKFAIFFLTLLFLFKKFNQTLFRKS